MPFISETSARPSNLLQVTSDLYASPAVSPQEIAIIKKDMENLEQKAAAKCVALFKIELLFERRHHIDGRPTLGALTMWESGSKLHGGGDALMYVCPGKSLGRNACEGVIPDAYLGHGVVVCPYCYTAWKSDLLIGQIIYRLSIHKWAEVVHRWFIVLGMNADLRLKHFYQDIRVAAEKEQARQLKGELLDKARSHPQRIARVYRLADLMKDVNAGADMYNRILDFLRT
jgi:hypothetical protein